MFAYQLFALGCIVKVSCLCTCHEKVSVGKQRDSNQAILFMIHFNVMMNMIIAFKCTFTNQHLVHGYLLVHDLMEMTLAE